MLRFEVGEEGQPPLPAIDLDDPVVVIGSATGARIRLPASAASPEHVRIADGRWVSQDTDGAIGDGHTFAIGNYRVRVAPAPAGSVVTPPQRTASLARELVRGLLGTDAAPTLTIERGPRLGAVRMLAPPASVLVLGREADWSIPEDEQLGRKHLELARSLEGVVLRDLGSRNGTRVNGKRTKRRALRSGDLIEAGTLAFRFVDPSGAVAADVPTGQSPAFYAACLVCALSLAGLAWVVAS